MWHRQQSYYRASPLIELSELAARLGFDRIWLKDERARWGTNSFKILGASWALHNALASSRNTGRPTPDTVFAATDGNHGRAVALLARRYGLRAEIFVPSGTADDRVRAIETEGARVRVIDGGYDDAVALAATTADDVEQGLLISDTARHVDDQTPEWAIQGYGTLYQEVEQLLPAGSIEAPDLLLVQIGVGGLAAAAVRHFRTGRREPFVVGVEPTTAACAAASIRAGGITTIDDAFTSVMAGLNAATPSVAAWTDLKYGVDAYLTIDDHWCDVATAELTRSGCPPGPTGAAGLAGLLALRALGDGQGLAARRPLLVLSEGP